MSKVASEKSKASASGKKGGKRKQKRVRSFKGYMPTLLRKTHEDLGISSSAKRVLDGVIADVLQAIAAEASQLTEMNKRKTISAKDLQTACSVVFPESLSRTGVIQGLNALNAFAKDSKPAKK
jgi:histone H3/H4